MASRAWLRAFSQASAFSIGMRRVQLAKGFVQPLSCSKPAPTVSEADRNKRRSSGSTYTFHSEQISVSVEGAGSLKIRCWAASTPSMLQLSGIWRSSSARNGSSSEISRQSFWRRNSIGSVGSLQGGKEQVAMKLLDIQLSALSHPAPQNRTAQLMHLEHVFFSFLFR